MSQFTLSVFRSLKSMFGADADVGFREQGYLLLATPETRAILAENVALQQSMGADIELLDGDGLARQFSWLATDGVAAGGYGRTGEGWFDPPSLAALFRKAAQQRGVTLLHDDVIGIEAGTRVEAVRLASGAPHRLRRADQCGRSLGGRAGSAGRAAAAGRAAQALRLRHRQPRGVGRPASRAADRRSVRRVVPPGRQAVPVRAVARREWRAARREPRRHRPRLLRQRGLAEAGGARSGVRRPQGRQCLGGLLRLQHARPQRRHRPASRAGKLLFRQRLLRTRRAAGRRRRPRHRRADPARCLPDARPDALRLRAHRRAAGRCANET